MESRSNTLRRIVLYLETHPRALDTIDGIASWWVREDRRAVQRGLDLLERAGVVERKELGGAVYFALRAEFRNLDSHEIMERIESQR